MEYGLAQWMTVYGKQRDAKGQSLIVRNSWESYVKALEAQKKKGFYLVDTAYGW